MPIYECVVREGNLCLKLNVNDEKEAFHCMKMMLDMLENTFPFYWDKRNIGFKINEVHEENEENNESEEKIETEEDEE